TDLRRHSMVVSAARPKTRFDDLARQLSFLNILNEAGIRMKGARQMRLATIPVMRMESEMGTACVSWYFNCNGLRPQADFDNVDARKGGGSKDRIGEVAVQDANSLFQKRSKMRCKHGNYDH
ncbi:MAG: hypothetical protein ACK5PZ_12940, partial [Pirellula sp.]